ncbi:hypothetical protein mRhiFer1_008727 [Rhinolophus ferrumequinum]|uniref:Uncharacterized protein n=1 Tax=Rhinolophus ferrumequinum TaxID=59479 RepID=A0A7J7TRG3_RHIFE|nr:hypothetical protein mRhiFer1_008727 [Rhinolophus ferrumequinum]
MEQYTANSNNSTEQIVVQAGQIQQQVQGQPAINGTGQWKPVNHIKWPTHYGPGCHWWTRSNHHASGTQRLPQIQLVAPGQIQIQGGQAVQVHSQTQQIIIQQPQTAITTGQTQAQQQIAVQGQQVVLPYGRPSSISQLMQMAPCSCKLQSLFQA